MRHNATDYCGILSVGKGAACWSLAIQTFLKRGAKFGIGGALFAVLALGALFSNAARAQQNTADVVGTVTDTSGAVVPGASVTITNTQTNISQTVPSSAGGDFDFNLLQVGSYSVRVEAKGFKTFSVGNLALSSGDRARVDAKLEVGDVTQTSKYRELLRPHCKPIPQAWELWLRRKVSKTCL